MQMILLRYNSNEAYPYPKLNVLTAPSQAPRNTFDLSRFLNFIVTKTAAFFPAVFFPAAFLPAAFLSAAFLAATFSPAAFYEDKSGR